MRFLLLHPYLALFGIVLVEQLGLPLPSTPFLLAGGALAATGQASLPLVLFSSTLATLLSDNAWYEVGRRRGSSVLSFLCRISLEPDSCVRHSEDLFARHGVRTLLVSKFVPGLGIVAAPMAGILSMKRLRFSSYAAVGALLWVATYVFLGYAFADQLEDVARFAYRIVGSIAVLVGSLLALWFSYKYFQRHRFLRKLRVDRIRPEELREKLERGELIVVVDLRHSLDFEADPETIPGAIRVAAEDFEADHAQIPRDREIVLYCT